MFENTKEIWVIEQDEQEFTNVYEGLEEEENEVRGTGNFSEFEWEFVKDED